MVAPQRKRTSLLPLFHTNEHYNVGLLREGNISTVLKTYESLITYNQVVNTPQIDYKVTGYKVNLVIK